MNTTMTRVNLLQWIGQTATVMRNFSIVLVIAIATSVSYFAPYVIEGYTKAHPTNHSTKTDDTTRGGGRGGVITPPPPHDL